MIIFSHSLLSMSVNIQKPNITDKFYEISFIQFINDKSVIELQMGVVETINQ